MDVIKVRRANVTLHVPDEQRGEYLAKGFDVVDENNNVLEHTVPTDLNTLKAAYSNHIKEIDKLRTENKKLKADLRAAKRKEES